MSGVWVPLKRLAVRVAKSWGRSYFEKAAAQSVRRVNRAALTCSGCAAVFSPEFGDGGQLTDAGGPPADA